MDQTPQPQCQPSSKRTARIVFFWIVGTSLALPLIGLIALYVVCPLVGVGRVMTVPTAAMEPTIQSGDEVFVNERISGNPPVRGDLVVFLTANLIPGTPPDTKYVKRVVGLPGESLSIKDQVLCVDGNPVPEFSNWKIVSIPYSGILSNEGQAFLVPANAVFVMGDNTAKSADSRIFGPVPLANLVGKVEFRIRPLDKFGKLK